MVDNPGLLIKNPASVRSAGVLELTVASLAVLVAISPAAATIRLQENTLNLNDTGGNSAQATTPTPTLPTSTPTATATPSHTAGLHPCAGDCDGSGEVTVDEILTMVNIALGDASITACEAGESDADGRITVDEILLAVDIALGARVVCIIIPAPTPSPAVGGTVLLPNGQLVRRGGSLLRRFAELILGQAQALVGIVEHVGRNVPVHLSLLRPSDGALVPLGTALTNDQGQYQIALPPDTNEDTCRLIVSVGDMTSGTLTRAFVFSTIEPIDVDFSSETAVRLILSRVAGGTSLCDFSSRGIQDIVDALRALPGMVPGNVISELNANAIATATAAPAIQATLNAALPSPTPTPSIGVGQ